jgi:hypothetical protein
MGDVLFVSHQWLGIDHPDPNMDQLKVLQAALKNLFDRKVEVVRTGLDMVQKNNRLYSKTFSDRDDRIRNTEH